jgi:hypothetical protein
MGQASSICPIDNTTSLLIAKLVSLLPVIAAIFVPVYFNILYSASGFSTVPYIAVLGNISLIISICFSYSSEKAFPLGFVYDNHSCQ